MSIIYTVITRNRKTVLCEFTRHNGNFQQISMHLLGKISQDVKTLSIEYDRYKFYLKNEILYSDNTNKYDENLKGMFVISFMCLLNKDEDSEEIIFEYLETIKNEFFSLFDRKIMEKSFAYSLGEFITVLKNQMKIYNNVFKKKKMSEAGSDISRSQSQFFKSEIPGNIIKNILDNLTNSRMNIIVAKPHSIGSEENLLIKPKKKKKKLLILVLLILFTIAVVIALILVLKNYY